MTRRSFNQSPPPSSNAASDVSLPQETSLSGARKPQVTVSPKGGARGKQGSARFDLTKLPIRVLVCDEPIDFDALREAMEQLLLAVEPEPESDSGSHLGQFDDPRRQSRSLSRVPRKPGPRSTGGWHTVG